jgi:hypothetical protein
MSKPTVNPLRKKAKSAYQALMAGSKEMQEAEKQAQDVGMG